MVASFWLSPRWLCFYWDGNGAFLPWFVCVLTMAAFGWMFSTALLTIPVEKLVNGNTQLISWLSTAVVFLMLGVLLVSFPELCLSPSPCRSDQEP